MKRCKARAPWSLIAVAGLLLQVSPVAALGSAVEDRPFALGLEQTAAASLPQPAAEAPAKPAGSWPEGTSREEPLRLAALDLRSPQMRLAVAETEGGAGGASERKHGFGRWLKKHWYVPVVLAVAVGVVIADDDDSDAGGEED